MAPIAAPRTLWVAAAVLIVAMVAAAANKDVDALTALRKGLSDPDGVLTSWDPRLATDPCEWFHVTCDGANRVTRL